MRKRRTNEEYVLELKDKNPTVVPLEEFKGMAVKIKHRCTIHDIEWMVTPVDALRGHGCPQCHRERQGEPKRKTSEEYIQELKDKGINVIPLENYINTKTPILHRCLKHNIEWEMSPSNVLGNKGCPECGKEKYHASRAKTQEQYIDELKSKNPNVEPVEEYAGARVSILHRCLIHDIEWKSTPGNILRGHGCPLCRREKAHMRDTKTTEQYINELKEKGISAIPLEEYNNAKTPILHKCLKHNVDWPAPPTSVLMGHGCPKCNSEKISLAISKTNEQYIADIKANNIHVEPLEEYKGSSKAILHMCTIHNVEWYARPDNILNGCGCPQCSKEKAHNALAKTHKQYLAELNEISPFIEPMEEYNSANEPILHLCTRHNYKWYATPHYILGGYGCPACSESKGERRIRLWLDNHNIQHICQKRFKDCRDKSTLPFDFYIQSMNAIIEYDGRQHYVPIECFGGEDGLARTKKHDEIKTNYCIQKGIRLLRIPYYIENIEKELDSFIYNK